MLFVFRRDPRARLRYASLGSALGVRLLREYGIASDGRTLVLLDGRGAHVRSTAALRVARLLRWPWSSVYAAILVPRPVRDVVYRLIVRHRHRFGPSVDACTNPSPELRARMLDQTL